MIAPIKENTPPTFEEVSALWGDGRPVYWKNFGAPSLESPAARSVTTLLRRHVRIPTGRPGDEIESVHSHRVIFERRLLGRPGQPADYEAVFYRGREIERIPARPYAGTVPVPQNIRALPSG